MKLSFCIGSVRVHDFIYRSSSVYAFVILEALWSYGREVIDSLSSASQYFFKLMIVSLNIPYYGKLCFRTVLPDNEWKDEISVSNVNDVLSIIRSDYEKAYFVTGICLYDFL